MAKQPRNGKKPKKQRQPGTPARPKAEPRVSLAPLDFEEALEGLLAVQPPPKPESEKPDK